MTDTDLTPLHRRAAEVIADADALLITAGAGMGVDSGLPDFRGPDGFWRAYPAYRELGLGFEQLANPKWFDEDPQLAWGFYGHRMSLYRTTTPHAGFGLLKRWAEGKRHGAFVFTSNVDSAFQRSGFARDRLVECHGTFEYVQCIAQCGVGLVSTEGITVDVDPATFRARPPLPTCPRCGVMLRPNILLFADFDWDDSLRSVQDDHMSKWLANVRGSAARLAIVEMGAGTAIPTIRREGDRISRFERATLVRINTREPQVPHGHIGIPQGALAALTAIDKHIQANKTW